MRLMLTDENNVRIVLTTPIGQPGGEGRVYHVEGCPDLAAKIYARPVSAVRYNKLRAQISMLNSGVSAHAAWPKKIIFQNKHPVGFLMPRIDGKPIHLLYRPVDRKEHFATVTWQTLIAVARNLAAAFHQLHLKNVVVADVNETNVLITPKGEVHFIDCDSFQITSSDGTCYPCEVGVPFWTPTELQGKPFATTLRTPNHDAFGLAVMVFHLLFMGKHPFAGVPSDRQLMHDAPPIEDCIRTRQFAYSRHGSSTCLPPPFSLTLAHVPDIIGDLFERAFRTPSRPSPAEWYRALDLIECQRCDWGHVYYRRLSQCPWCNIWNNGGPNFFLSATGTTPDTVSDAAIDQLLSDIQRIQAPVLGEVEIVGEMLAPLTFTTPTLDSLQYHSVQPIPFPASLSPTRSAYVLGWVLTLGSAIMFVAAFSVWPLWLVAGSIGIGLLADGPSNKAFTHEIRRRRQAALDTFNAIESHLSTMSRHAANHVSAFNDRRNAMDADIRKRQTAAELELAAQRDALIAEVRALKARGEEIRKWRTELQRKVHESSQKEAFLRKYRIEHYRIPHIGATRSSLLSQYGIDTALDLYRKPYIPKMGQGADHLRRWLASLERQFKYDPSIPLDQEAQQDIRRRIRNTQDCYRVTYNELTAKRNSLRLLADGNRLRTLRRKCVDEHLAALRAMNEQAEKRHRSLASELERLVEVHSKAKVAADACPRVQQKL